MLPSFFIIILKKCPGITLEMSKVIIINDNSLECYGLSHFCLFLWTLRTILFGFLTLSFETSWSRNRLFAILGDEAIHPGAWRVLTRLGRGLFCSGLCSWWRTLMWVRLLSGKAQSHVTHSENILPPSRSWVSGRGTPVPPSSFHKKFLVLVWLWTPKGQGPDWVTHIVAFSSLLGTELCNRKK